MRRKFKKMKKSTTCEGLNSSSCAYCTLNYTWIGKMETFSSDAKHIFDASGISKLLQPSEVTYHRHYTVTNRDASAARTRKHFRTLDRATIQSLYELYRLDFEMFGYSAEEYLLLEEM